MPEGQDAFVRTAASIAMTGTKDSTRPTRAKVSHTVRGLPVKRSAAQATAHPMRAATAAQAATPMVASRCVPSPSNAGTSMSAPVASATRCAAAADTVPARVAIARRPVADAAGVGSASWPGERDIDVSMVVPLSSGVVFGGAAGTVLRPREPDVPLELLAERGVTGTSVDAIVERSGVAKTTIYRHWPTRGNSSSMPSMPASSHPSHPTSADSGPISMS